MNSGLEVAANSFCLLPHGTFFRSLPISLTELTGTVAKRLKEEDLEAILKLTNLRVLTAPLGDWVKLSPFPHLHTLETHFYNLDENVQSLVNSLQFLPTLRTLTIILGENCISFTGLTQLHHLKVVSILFEPNLCHFNLPQLRSLCFDDVPMPKYEDHDPEGLCVFSHLTKLSMLRIRNTLMLPHFMSRVPLLEELQLEPRSFRREDFDNPEGELVFFPGTPLEIDPSHLACFPALKKLTTYPNSLLPIAVATQLEILDLKYVDLTASELLQLTSLRNLRNLNVRSFKKRPLLKDVARKHFPYLFMHADE